MYRAIFKRIIDFVIAVLLIFILIIPFILIAFAILIDSPGPIFYKQTRVGINLKNFQIFKFRTMCANADKIGGYSTERSDKRITKIGKYLRKTSIDELPQIFNVLFGEMSLIGPRPNVPQQCNLYTKEDYYKRHICKPGISGLAQVRNRHNSTERIRLKYDLFYIDKYSFLLDLKIVFWTLKTVLRGSY